MSRHNKRILVCIGALSLLSAVAVFLGIRQRQEQCRYIPLISAELLPNAMLLSAKGSHLPDGWGSAAEGVELRGRDFSSDPTKWGLDLDGDGRVLQLLGIANEVRTPAIPIFAGQSYCFVGRVLTDSDKSATHVRILFNWRDGEDKIISTNTTDWLPVPQWTAQNKSDWSFIRASSTAPASAHSLIVRVQPSSDDRVYLDDMHVRSTLFPNTPFVQDQQRTVDSRLPKTVEVLRWPHGAKAAISFSFDWETAMGGLIHTRSNKNDDPNFIEDWQLRAMRMRNGVTTTLDLFRPYGIRATYYATGYAFLLGNTEQRRFMDNPTYTWANASNGWNDRWNRTPWFADDPYGTTQSDPLWYFGDLIPKLLTEKQDIQSHTFAHFAGSYVHVDDWNKDFTIWREVAAARGVAPARSLAFPWSASNGMSDDEWNTLAAQGITSVTRTAWSQRKSALFPKDTLGIVRNPVCKSVPGHETILACPDFYLRDGTAPAAIQQVNLATATGGVIDLWAHPEEVTTPTQMATWQTVVQYVAQKQDAGELWVAPLSEIADWQQARGGVTIQMLNVKSANAIQPISFEITNNSKRAMEELTLRMPAKIRRITVDGVDLPVLDSVLVTLKLAAGHRAEAIAWP